MGGQPESCQLCFHLHILFRFLFHFFVSNRFTRISRIEKKKKREEEYQVNFCAIDPPQEFQRITYV